MTLSKIFCTVFSNRHMGDELPFNLKALFTRAVIYLGRKIYINTKGQGPLPRFELIQYRPVNSAGGKNNQFASWKDALNHMIDEISNIDFDVALLGCAVYGVPLSVHIKRMGKIAIYTGGATQAIFGIKGERWDNDNIYNEHWARPFPDDIPERMEVIENGSFV